MKKDNVTNEDFYPWGFELFSKWIQIVNNEKSFLSFFKDNHLKTVAIYGYGTIGKRLVEQLKKDGVNVEYLIDRNKANIKNINLPIYLPDEKLPTVDVVIVTPIFFYEIEELLHGKYGDLQNVVSIEDVINYCVE